MQQVDPAPRAPAGRGNARSWEGTPALRRWLPVAVIFVVFVAVWQAVVSAFHISRFLIAAPSDVAISLWQSLHVRPFIPGSLIAATINTYSAALLAFFLAAALGLLLAAGMNWVPVLQAWFLPYVVAFQSLPRLAIAPLFIIWFGHGTLSKVVLSGLLALFPVLINTLAGLSATDPLSIDLLRSLGASRAQIFRHYLVHNALPYIFAGLELGLVFSVLGVLVAEFVGASGGLGEVILQREYSVDIAGVFGVLLDLVVVGLVLRAVLLLIRRRLLFWMDEPLGRA